MTLLTPKVIRIAVGVILLISGLYGAHINDPYRFESDNYCRYHSCPDVEWPTWVTLTLIGGVILLFGPLLWRAAAKSWAERVRTAGQPK
jgi:hypothetical protein